MRSIASAKKLSVRFASVSGLAVIGAACGGAGGGAAPAANAPTQAAAKPTAAPAAAAPAATTAAVPAAATAAPAAAQPGAMKSSKDTLTLVSQANQGSLDGHFAATNQELLVTRNIYSSLLKYKPDTTELTGDLATSWDSTPDGLSYTFKLRQDVEWQKGFGHFTAADVKGSFDRLRAPETKSPFAGAISMLQEVQVVDDYTVKFILSQPYAAFPHLLTNYRDGPIINVKAVQQFGKDYDWNPVGTGPYQFESGVPKQEAIVTAFDKYYGGVAPIKRVVTRTIPDINAQVVGLENGQYDMMFVAPEDPAVVKRLADKGFVRTKFSRTLPEVLLMNVTVKPFHALNVPLPIPFALPPPPP